MCHRFRLIELRVFYNSPTKLHLKFYELFFFLPPPYVQISLFNSYFPLNFSFQRCFYLFSFCFSASVSLFVTYRLTHALYLHFFSLFPIYIVYITLLGNWCDHMIYHPNLWAQGEQKNYNYMGKQYHVDWVYPRERGICYEYNGGKAHFRFVLWSAAF